jgi:hypothetical protein
VGASRACGRPLRQAEDGVRHAINQAKLAELRAELAAAEAQRGKFTTDDVRRYGRDHLDRYDQTAKP